MADIRVVGKPEEVDEIVDVLRHSLDVSSVSPPSPYSITGPRDDTVQVLLKARLPRIDETMQHLLNAASEIVQKKWITLQELCSLYPEQSVEALGYRLKLFDRGEFLVVSVWPPPPWGGRYHVIYREKEGGPQRSIYCEGDVVLTRE